MKIGQYDFNKLPNEKKVEIASFSGTFLENRIVGAFGINLYNYNRFYFEVWLDRRKNQIERVVTFIQLRYLEPYIEHIDLKGF